MNYIFESAKKGDFSNFRYLCDPYGENDRSIDKICSIELLSTIKKEQFANALKNGRIIGESKVTKDKVEIEFAAGPNSDKLEKIKLIKRNNLWYLYSN